MAKRERSSQEFKDSVIAKILNRGDRTIVSVCEEVGVLKVTAASWIKACGSGPRNPGGRRMKWTPEAKLKAVSETSNLPDHDLGIYLRREGLYSNQITEWRSGIIGYFNDLPKFAKDARDEKIRLLERELLRKDKALAEVSALLILEKKVGLFWGSRSEDEK